MSDLTYLILYVSGCLAVALSFGALVLWIFRDFVSAFLDKHFPCKRLTDKQINNIFKK